MNLTREQAIAEHRKMWNWIADKTEKLKRKVEKEEYFREMGIANIPRSECYCCEYLFSGCIVIQLSYCKNECAINWGENLNCIDSYYQKWIFIDGWQQSARLARIIANLPEREVSD